MTLREAVSGPIVVGVDDSPEARAAGTYGAELAASRPGGELLLAHAYRAPTGFLDVAGRGMVGELERAAKRLVDELAAELRQTCSVPIETVLDAGKPVPFLSKLAESASRVVVGQDTATMFDRMTFGSVAGHLAANVPSTLAIVPASWHPSSLGEHPVVALSGDHPVQATLSTAIAEAKHLGTRVVLLHTVKESTSAAELEEHRSHLTSLVEAAQAADGVAIETRIVRGHPDAFLVKESVNAAVAVVGRSHRHGIAGWMRSVAHAVAKRTHCPLIIVPAS